ncbi:MAG: prephenate dehydratase [Anaerolineales bacterium]|nr:prephenate dehydratase [Anaerolineales bacterium]
MRVAFQGEAGAFSEEACQQLLGPVETQACESFDDVFEAVASGDCERGLIPIENSLAGSIHQNYDLLLRHDLYIVGETFLRVRHCLIGFPGVAVEQVRKVISHPQALGQCAASLRALGVKTEAVYDTAGSVKLLKQSGERVLAAVASRRAAEIYGMQILREGIEDNPENFTRFLAISRQSIAPGAEAKTTIVFTLKNTPGALFKALSVFALREIDLTKIESRPLPGKTWDYLFYVDFIGALQEETIRRALDHLGEYAPLLRILGTYPRAILV